MLPGGPVSECFSGGVMYCVFSFVPAKIRMTAPRTMSQYAMKAMP